jgi:tetratricopeptide (TPR) repeat protein
MNLHFPVVHLHAVPPSMLRTTLAMALLCLHLGSGSAAAAWPQWMERTVLDPTWRERLLFNPDERTERAVESLETDPAKAAQNLETAKRLSGNEPLASYNAGTGQLAAQNFEAAAQNLESAVLGAAEAEAQLASSANYNLGNARFGAQDLPGAIDAYKEALRNNPGFEDAKHNLELSQRLLKEQQEQNQDQENQDQEQDQENEDQEDKDQEQKEQEDKDQEQQDQEQQQDQEDEEQEDKDQEQQQQDQNKEQQESPLPQFQDLPDMSAEEAAAILEAIENMERDQRRQEALEAAKTNSGTKKDW